MSEAALEAACCRYARRRGVLSRKLHNQVAGDPDRVFFLPHARCWLVEFKGPGGRVSPRQRVVHEQFKAAGHHVSIIWSVDVFRVALDILME